MAEAEFETDSSVRGYHMYQDNWTPVMENDFTANGNYFPIVKQEKFQW